MYIKHRAVRGLLRYSHMMFAKKIPSWEREPNLMTCPNGPDGRDTVVFDLTKAFDRPYIQEDRIILRSSFNPLLIHKTSVYKKIELD